MGDSPSTGLAGVPLRVALTYAAGAGAWILLSDLAAALALGSATTELWTNVGKGLLFVAVSAGLLYVVLQRSLGREQDVRAELEAAQKRLTSAVAQMPFTFAIYDTDRRFRFLNTHGLIEANRTLGEVVGRRDEEVFPLELVNAYLPVLNRALETRRAQTEVVDIALPSRRMHLAYTFTPLLNADGSVREVLAVTNDMTAVVRNDRRVRQLNRTLAAISSANSVLVRARDEASLLRDFCDDLAANTEHRLVVVCFATDPERLRVAAQAGPAAVNFGGIQLDDVLPPAAFPVPAATIRDQRTAVCHDFETDGQFAAGRERARAAGLRSAVGLPLGADGKVFGALCLYSAEPGRFDEDEVRMLVELADDLAFGLTAMRQRAELAQSVGRLRASEERLRTLKLVIDQSPSVAYVMRVEPGWPVEFISDSIARFGYQPEEFISGGRAVSSILHPADLPRVAAECDQAVAGGSPQFTQEYRLFDARGETRWVRDQCVVVRDAAGQATHFRGIVTDITEERRATEELVGKTAFLEAQVDSALDGILVVDSQGKKLLQNERFNELWQVPRAIAEDADDRKQLEFATSRTRDPAQFAAKVAHLYAHPEQTSRDEVELVDGTTLDRYSSPVRGRDGRHFGRIWTFRDITERKRATAQLRLQSAALEAAANAIVITDAQGRIEWVNAAFTKSTGYSLAEVVGQNPRLLKSGQHPREFYAGLWKTILAGHVWHGEMHNRRKDGSLYDEEMTIAPVRDAAGRVTHFIAIKQDITEHKRLEKQFLRAQRLEGIGLLAGGIAHDLNNVLAPILMGADLLKMLARDEQTAQQLDSIVQSAKRGADIVKQVLTFARGIEGERVVLHPKHVLKEMVRLARETFPRNVQFTVDVPGHLWPVHGDPTQLHQVLLNLSVNARDAMAGGGTLSYSAANVTVDDALAQANPGAKPGPHVVLRVQDTGSGIPPEVLDRIFEPFFTTKELGKGTGLGLSTVIGIVRSHGGFVTVSSEVARGTTFEVYLPASPEAAGQLAPPSPEPLPEGRGELILVVDDEDGILQVTRRMLEAHGYRVLTADDGTTALTQVSNRPGEVALIITDVMMPFMDGVQLIRALRKLAPGLKVIASSGMLGLPGQKDRTDEVLALGVKHILHKPYGIETLLRTVHEELHAGAEAVGDGI